MNNKLSEIKIGIDAIGIKLPKYALELSELSVSHGKDSSYYTENNGGTVMSLCLKKDTVLTLAVEAIKRALENWHGNIKDIGFFAVGTESSFDFARPLSLWISDEIGMNGNVRSYEIKSACSAGTLAVKQATEWLNSDTSNQKAALVVAVDECLYSPNHPGENTQGAAAIAMIITHNPKLCSIDQQSYCYSAPIKDFYKPVSAKYPVVQGKLSIVTYKNALLNCYNQLVKQHSLKIFEDADALCFHTPCPKLVILALKAVAEKLQIPNITEIIRNKVTSNMQWNKVIGNSYTASLWISIAQSLISSKGQIIAYSYGSGCNAELLTLNAHSNYTYWSEQVAQDLANREFISGKQYYDMRYNKKLF